ncbi:MAG: hypothetical protein J1F17_05740 [Oscillospiraceae bacterium]|nr:hypothetical protein [Oscillospiraceae bacterium]
MSNKTLTGNKQQKIFQIFQKGFISGNAIKIIALVTMTIDHIGVNFFPDIYIFRIIGRISFPLFSYMIAEGCRYTRNKLKYFFSVFLLGTLCQIVYYIADNSLYMGVLITFSISILIIFSIQWAKNNCFNPFGWILPFSVILWALFLCEILPLYLSDTNYHIDYRFFGIMLPVIISLSDRRDIRFILATAGTVVLALSLTEIQWWGLLSLIPLALYNGKRGKMRIKYLFYIYYPAHLLIIDYIATLT